MANLLEDHDILEDGNGELGARVGRDIPDGDSLKARFQKLLQPTTLVRAKGAYGKKADFNLLREISQYGEVSTFHYDEATGESTINTTQDVELILKANVHDFNEGGGWNEDRTASIAARTRWGRAGSLVIRAPVACLIAPRMAGAVGTSAGSPIPLAPKGPSGSGSSTR